jgi:hypothetical protein
MDLLPVLSLDNFQRTPPITISSENIKNETSIHPSKGLFLVHVVDSLNNSTFTLTLYGGKGQTFGDPSGEYIVVSFSPFNENVTAFSEPQLVSKWKSCIKATDKTTNNQFEFIYITSTTGTNYLPTIRFVGEFEIGDIIITTYHFIPTSPIVRPQSGQEIIRSIAEQKVQLEKAKIQGEPTQIIPKPEQRRTKKPRTIKPDKGKKLYPEDYIQKTIKQPKETQRKHIKSPKKVKTSEEKKIQIKQPKETQRKHIKSPKKVKTNEEKKIQIKQPKETQRKHIKSPKKVKTNEEKKIQIKQPKETQRKHIKRLKKVKTSEEKKIYLENCVRHLKIKKSPTDSGVKCIRHSRVKPPKKGDKMPQEKESDSANFALSTQDIN